MKSAAIGNLCLEACISVSVYIQNVREYLTYLVNFTNRFICYVLQRKTIEVYFIIFRSVDHQWNFDRFATGGAGVEIWNHNRF